MLPFLKGAAWLALRTGSPVVPSGIVGTAHVREPGTKRRFRKKVRIAFGPPIAVEHELDARLRRKKAEQLTEELLAAITALLR